MYFFFTKPNSSSHSPTQGEITEKIEEISIIKEDSKKEEIPKNIIVINSDLKIFQELENSQPVQNSSEEEIPSFQNNKSLSKNLDKENHVVAAEEVINKLFPNLKERIGQKEYDEFLTTFPFFYMQLIPSKMTTTQKEEFLKIQSFRSADGDINIPDYELTAEEILKKRKELNLKYIPDFINIFTEQQQKEFIDFVEEARWKSK